jgi:hypothetical protein
MAWLLVVGLPAVAAIVVAAILLRARAGWRGRGRDGRDLYPLW